MSLTASVLKNNDLQKKAVMKEVNTIISRADSDIKIAHEQGKHNVLITVPVLFQIPYMSVRDAQRIIYYKILQSLLSREFDVKISIRSDVCLFDVTWISSEEQHEIDLQNALLAQYTKKDNSDLELK